MSHTIQLDGNSLTLEQLAEVAHARVQVKLADKSVQLLHDVRARVEKIAVDDKPHYGINTGFGALAETRIANGDLKQLQRNLILSHAVGVGEPLTVPQARALMLLRANTLAKGFSGARVDVVEHLLALLNAGCAPYVPSRGSVGASGDLAPLAHVALLLIGEGDAFVDGKRVTAQAALKHAGLQPLVLEAKEGLALINGTQAMCAVGGLALLQAEELAKLADLIGAASLIALQGRKDAFDARIHDVRPHPGQLKSAENLRAILQDYDDNHAARVQDPYSLRCMPQVHGATRDALSHVRDVLSREINSATDNPLVFANGVDTDVISGGNFHGQPLAFALDYLAIAASELASISERRLEQMLNPALSAGLPPFLTPNPGLNSGLMIIQLTAAALVNENKVLSHPASTDSIPTSANREDHVSMGMTSANKAVMVIANVRQVLALELLAACQAIDLRGAHKLSGPVAKLHKKVRTKVQFHEQDQWLAPDIAAVTEICAGTWL